jgi:ABC-type lipoprotein export system ATPase subunit
MNTSSINELGVQHHVIAVRDLVKTYPLPAGDFTAVDGIDLSVGTGEFVTVVGRSGSGKTTLLNLPAGIDRPTTGQIVVAGEPVHALRGSKLAAWRGRTIGLVFQFFQLLPTLTVAENVMLPMDFCATVPSRQRRPRALGLLDRMGIACSAAGAGWPSASGCWPWPERCSSPASTPPADGAPWSTRASPTGTTTWRSG